LVGNPNFGESKDGEGDEDEDLEGKGEKTEEAKEEDGLAFLVG
jgi:hypothetical protein